MTDCQRHGTIHFYDKKTRASRCSDCGHRISRAGEPVKQTREMSPRQWLPELLGRRRAKRAVPK
jgi:hypothetical protein